MMRMIRVKARTHLSSFRILMNACLIRCLE